MQDAIQATSVPSERAFSRGRRIKHYSREKLLDGRFRDIMLMKNLSQPEQDHFCVAESETKSDVNPTEAPADEQLSSESESVVENEDSRKHGGSSCQRVQFS